MCTRQISKEEKESIQTEVKRTHLDEPLMLHITLNEKIKTFRAGFETWIQEVKKAHYGNCPEILEIREVEVMMSQY